MLFFMFDFIFILFYFVLFRCFLFFDKYHFFRLVKKLKEMELQKMEQSSLQQVLYYISFLSFYNCFVTVL